ncbi:very short patch repair endonuclease [Nocardia jiangxiensis]|uniref:Very short patch repair endonuclease n=1 Tax=Nocardia jiangxiensis TaxID=282685 RepID=A0ABW6RSA8_9NOCA
MPETPEQRSRTMRAVRSQDTKPEMAVRRFLHAAGLRYKLHDPHLPGKPDLVLPGRRTVVFVHGCFWHQHPGCRAADRPASNTEYWTRKLDGNVSRDIRKQAELESQGWKVLVIWECQTRDRSALNELRTAIESIPIGQQSRSHRRP